MKSGENGGKSAKMVKNDAKVDKKCPLTFVKTRVALRLSA